MMTFQAPVFVCFYFIVFKKITCARQSVLLLAISTLFVLAQCIIETSFVVISFLRARSLFTAFNYYFNLT